MNGDDRGSLGAATEPAAEFVAKNREVQRLLGRCLLRIQQLERVLKAVVVVQHHYGSGADSAQLAQQRAAHVAKLGMGDLVDIILSELIHVRTVHPDRGGTEVERPSRKGSAQHRSRAAALGRRHGEAQAKAEADGRPWFETRLTLSATPEQSKAIVDRLTALVQLRNRVVHHFCEEHEIRTEAGCDRAIAFLEETDAGLVTHSDHVREWALVVDDAREACAKTLSDPAELDRMFRWAEEGASPAVLPDPQRAIDERGGG